MEALAKVTLIYLTAVLPSATSIIIKHHQSYFSFLEGKTSGQLYVNPMYLFSLISSGNQMIDDVNGRKGSTIALLGGEHISLFVCVCVCVWVGVYVCV